MACHLVWSVSIQLFLESQKFSFSGPGSAKLLWYNVKLDRYVYQPQDTLEFFPTAQSYYYHYCSQKHCRVLLPSERRAAEGNYPSNQHFPSKNRCLPGFSDALHWLWCKCWHFSAMNLNLQLAGSNKHLGSSIRAKAFHFCYLLAKVHDDLDCEFLSSNLFFCSATVRLL